MMKYTHDEKIRSFSRKRTGLIYLMQTEEALKIGFTTKPVERFRKIQNQIDRDLVFVGCFTATHNDEIELHKRFKAFSLDGGEWYPLSVRPVLLDHLRNMDISHYRHSAKLGRKREKKVRVKPANPIKNVKAESLANLIPCQPKYGSAIETKPIRVPVFLVDEIKAFIAARLAENS